MLRKQYEISIADDIHSLIEDKYDKDTNSRNSNESVSSNRSKVISTTEFNSKEMYYYKYVNKYFKNNSLDVINKMIDIIEKDSDISLRILDWFVTRYSNKYNISYKLSENDIDDFNVHISYKAQLKSYKKRYFDPFRRRKKFNYYYHKTDKSKYILTTIGQLNFFRWAFANKIIEYVEKYHKDISKAMNKSNKEEKKKKTEKLKLKKEQNIKKVKKIIKIDNKKINISADKKVKNDFVKIIVTFD
jgi:hypothetical protein